MSQAVKKRGTRRNDINQTIRVLSQMLRGFVRGRYALALGGSLAKGKGDALSDLDLYLFADELTAVDDRRQLIVSTTGRDQNLWVGGTDLSGVGGSGTDFDYGARRVETLTRGIPVVERVLAACQEGQYESWLSVWNPWGFYSHVLLSDVATARILEDPQGVLGGWQRQLRKYPAKLKENIVRRHLGAARFWPWNFHYQSAVKRKDFVYTQGIAGQVAHHLVQVLYALNEKYYPGDKKNLADLRLMEIKPHGFGRDLQQLLAPPARLPGTRQQALLQRMVAAVTACAQQAGLSS